MVCLFISNLRIFFHEKNNTEAIERILQVDELAGPGATG
ncbi:3-alpha domain-containing protein [Aneurinibacillus tyrosinisolvens]